MKIFLVTITGVLLFMSCCKAQFSLPIIFEDESKRSAEAGILKRNHVVYVSLTDVLAGFGFNFRTDEALSKTEFHSGDFTVSISVNSPFAVITDKQNNTSIVQFSHEARRAANTLFVHLESFIGVLKTVQRKHLSFDREAMVLRVGEPSSSVAISEFDITGMTCETKANGYLIRIHATKPLKDFDSWKKPEGDHTWLYVTFANANADVAMLQSRRYPEFVKNVLVFPYPASVQITVKLKGKIHNTELVYAEGSHDLLINVYFPEPESPVMMPTESKGTKPLGEERNRWKLDCIVIDAGHGGHDPGTIGVRRTREKDITLSISMKLGKLIEEFFSDVRVVYTRTTDTFVELYRRGQIANQSEGKLFISIHCNSTPKKPSNANGFEIYLLRPGKTDAAIRIAERENEVVKLEKDYEQRYQHLNEENFILLTMAQSAYVKYSEQFADILQREMGNHLEINNNGVKQAGFYVLVGASMPNVLIETGYLSNRDEEMFLKSPQGQQKIADAIFRGIKHYKENYERSLGEGLNEIE